MEVLKVSSKSNPNSVAGAMAGVVRHSGSVEVQVVGAGALNQAIKAIAIARGYLTPSGVDLICVPTFADIEIDGQSRTAMRLLVESRDRNVPDATGPHAPAHGATVPDGKLPDGKGADAASGVGAEVRGAVSLAAASPGADGNHLSRVARN